MTRLYYDPSRYVREETGTSISETNVAKVLNIAARDVLDTSIYKLVEVEDATGDSTVSSGGALYYYSDLHNTWIKASEDESMDTTSVIEW